MDFKFETLAIHSGQKIDSESLSRAVPVHRTSAYMFKSAEHAANLFSLKEPGYIYTRIGNPTQEILETRMASLEGGAAALALASGTSAIFYSIINICSSGDEFVSANNLYGGTHTLFNDILKQFNIKCNFFDIRDLSSLKKVITGATKAIFIETVGNPGLDVADISEISKIAKSYEIPLIVDSTFTPPCILKPIDHGADIVIHSLTKWIGGHGTAIGGIVIDSGKFNWKNPKFKLFNEPDSSYHDLRFAHDLGDMNNIAFTLRMRLVPLRNLGSCITPDNSWIFLQGIETLALRMERHSSNAIKAAMYLKSHKNVAWVRYPGLEEDPSYETAKKYMKNGFGGMVVFGVKGGKEAGAKFISNLTLFSHLANVGDAKSLAIHPATTTHSQLNESDQIAGGITPDLIRLSIGIENIDDIIADLERSL